MAKGSGAKESGAKGSGAKGSGAKGSGAKPSRTERPGAKPSRAQRETVGRVMHAFKHGDLRTHGDGSTVEDPRQAIAIALHEAGASNRESPAANRAHLRRTKAGERRAEAGGRAGGEPTRALLYAEAKRRGIAGRAGMSKAALRQALGRA